MEEAVVWRNARLAICDDAMRTIEAGALVTRGARLEWVGDEQELPRDLLRGGAIAYDLKRAWVTPGLIDCHTHLVFAGNRADEYGARIRGATYEAIARAGGGILSTVRATRAASVEQLVDESAPRLEALLAEGVTTVEIKSGYGLTLEHEARMLRAARKLGEHYPVTVRTTLLAAHAVPPEYTGRAEDYLEIVTREWLPALQAEGLVDAVDVFCDRIGFDRTQSIRVLEAAVARSLPVKMHAEQLANLGGSRAAAALGALSCDHLEHATPDDVAAMAQAGTIAVLLPVAFHCLGETVRPPIDAMRRQGAGMAVATDCNPGSAPGASILLALAMAARSFGLTPAEVLGDATREAARALSRPARQGVLQPGFDADFAVWRIDSPDELGYWMGYNPCRAVVRAGKPARQAPGAWSGPFREPS